MRVHPIQLNYRDDGDVVVCGLCQRISAATNADTPTRVTHLVHLVREHLAEVNYTFTKKGMAEEIEVKE